MAPSRSSDQRGISPVVGVVAMVGIVVALAAVSGVLFSSLAEEREPSPDVTFSVEPGDVPAEYEIVHESGDGLEGGAVELRGAADPDALGSDTVRAGERRSIYAVEETVSVVWHGEDGTSYVIWEFDADTDETLPAPVENCEWVDDESNGGVDVVKAHGVTVDCDVTTDEDVEVQDGGVVIGDTVSETKAIDADDARLYGDAEAENVANVQRGLVTGTVTSVTADVKLDDTTVEGGANASKTVELINGSSVDGDAVSDDGTVKVLDSDVGGEIATDGDVKLQNATVEGDVYVADADFDCTDSTVNGQDCGEYATEDPGDY